MVNINTFYTKLLQYMQSGITITNTAADLTGDIAMSNGWYAKITLPTSINGINLSGLPKSDIANVQPIGVIPGDLWVDYNNFLRV